MAEAAAELGQDVGCILDLGLRSQLSIGTITPSGQTLFLISEDIHRFIAGTAASALNAGRAVEVSVFIVRAFVAIRRAISEHSQTIAENRVSFALTERSRR